jgi:hypothetical protein
MALSRPFLSGWMPAPRQAANFQLGQNRQTQHQDEKKPFHLSKKNKSCKTFLSMAAALVAGCAAIRSTRLFRPNEIPTGADVGKPAGATASPMVSSIAPGRWRKSHERRFYPPFNSAGDGSNNGIGVRALLSSDFHPPAWKSNLEEGAAVRGKWGPLRRAIPRLVYDLIT